MPPNLGMVRLNAHKYISTSSRNEFRESIIIMNKKAKLA
jgi:hypothetical protein